MIEFQQTLIDDFNNALQNDCVPSVVAKYHAGIWRDPKGVVRYFIHHQGTLYYLVITNNQTFDVERIL